MKRWILSAVLLAAPAFAGELEGVTSPDTLAAEGKTLQLNGMACG